MTTEPNGPARLIDEQQNTILALQEELRRTNSELLQLTLELEDRVAERMSELETANGKLREEITVAKNPRASTCRRRSRGIHGCSRCATTASA